MRCVYLLFLVLAPACSLLGQGQVVFNNSVENEVSAPILDLAGQGLAGAGYTAQLFGGSERAFDENLQPLSPSAHFRTNAPGYVVPPNFTVTVPGVLEGERARLILRAWDNRNGTITNWLQIVEQPSIPHGESLPFITRPLGGVFTAPPNLSGLAGFGLSTNPMAATSIKINFQPSSTPVPLGYLRDSGEPFGPRSNGHTYGWVANHQDAVHENPSANGSDARHNTFIDMQPLPGAVWEIELPNGVYGVHLAAGNPLSLLANYRITIEGILGLHGTPSPGRNWVEADAVVQVSDGRLSLGNATGIVSNRLCFVEITPARPIHLQAQGSAGSPTHFGFQFEGDSVLKYQVQVSSNLFQWIPLGPVKTAASIFQIQEALPTGPITRIFRSQTLATPEASLFYSNNFQTTPGTEWSVSGISSAPAGQSYLGPFGSNDVRLLLSSLPLHTRGTVSFDLYLFGGWKGNMGPDTFKISMTNGLTLLKTTFGSSQSQAFPGNFPGSSFPARAGAYAAKTLGTANDSIYRLSYTFIHSSSAIEFIFSGATTDTLLNTSWGLANVSIHLQNDPYDL